MNFYPRPPRGGRQQITTHDGVTATFLSTPSARRATTKIDKTKEDLQKISIHALREEGDPAQSPGGTDHQISIHALREEGDRSTTHLAPRTSYFYPRPPRGGRRLYRRIETARKEVFLSTPSARRATGRCRAYYSRLRHFYPRPPRGGRPNFANVNSNGNAFLSTPSARRATTQVNTKIDKTKISIHALREEGDL